MKFDTNTIIIILRLILCNEEILTWLKAEAKKTSTPIDDTTIMIVEMLLCPKA